MLVKKYEIITKSLKKFFIDKTDLIILLGILFLAFFLRVICLDKSSGLWYDEAHGYYIAKQVFPFELLKKIYFEEVNPPLYFIIMHFWIILFGKSQIILRLLSVIFDVILIFVVYMTGKELHSRKLAITSALLFSVNSFLIYFSQEVRYYSLIALFTGLLILFLFKVKNNPSKFNFIGLILSNLGMVYTSSFGIVIFFLESLIFIIYFFFVNKKILKGFLIAQIITFILYLPFLPFFLYHLRMSETGIYFGVKKNFIISLMSAMTSIIRDWFSPLFFNSFNFDSVFLKIFNDYIFWFLFFFLFPVIICLLGIIKALKNNKLLFALSVMSFLFFLIEIYSAWTGKFYLQTKYTIVIFPIILFSVGYGLSIIKNKLLFLTLISFLIFSNLLYIILSPSSAPKFSRGHSQYRYIGQLLNKLPLNEKDIIVMHAGGTELDINYDLKSHMVTVDTPQCFSLENGGLEFILKNVIKKGDQFSVSDIKKQGYYKFFKEYIGSDEVSIPLERYLKKDVINKITPQRYLVLVFSKYIDRFSESDLKNIVKNDTNYKENSIIFMMSSKLNIDTLKIIEKHMFPVTIMEKGDWKVHVFQKRGFYK